MGKYIFYKIIESIHLNSTLEHFVIIRLDINN